MGPSNRDGSDPFSALGANVIDGSETPQGSFAFGVSGEVQVAVAPPGSAGGHRR
jgi:hypothetical protein